MSKRITINPKIQHGKPVISGTRVPVSRVVGGLAAGMTIEEVIMEYGINEKDIMAALDFAANLIELEEYHPLPSRKLKHEVYH